MKNKLILIVFLFTLLFSLGFINVKAETEEWKTFETSSGEKMLFETYNGDTVDFQKKIGYYDYRVVLGDKKLMRIDFSGKRISFIRFLESTSYYFLYGSIYNDYENNSKETIPYIVRIDKNFNSIYYYYDKNDDVSGMAHIQNLFEFGANNIVSLEFVNGSYVFPQYYGLYRLVQYDEDLNILSSLDVGENETYPSIAYDRLDYMYPDGSHVYFDKDFNLVGKYESFSVSGYYELMTSCKVNGTYYLVGTVFNEPGIYELDDGKHDKISVTITASVSLTGQSIGNAYKDYVEYKVTGGNVTINNEPAYLNGTVSKPGKYTIKVTGLNGYANETNFIISPELYTEIENGGTLSIGDQLEFSGVAKLNGTIVSSGYVLKEPGSYILDLCADDVVIEEIRFTVPEVFVTKESKTRIYIIMSIVIVLLAGSLTAYLIIGKKKKKKI